MKSSRFPIAAAAIALLMAPAIALSAPGDLSFVPGTAGCWKPWGWASAGCTNGSTGLESPREVLVSPDGRSVYVGGGSGGAGRLAVFSRNMATGELTQLTGTSACITSDGSDGECAEDLALAPVVGLAMSADGATLYAAVNAAGTDADGVIAYARNSSTGALTRASCVNAGGTSSCSTAAWLEDTGSVAVSPDGNSVYAGASTGSLGHGTVAAFARNAGTGALTPVTGAGNACVSNAGAYSGACMTVPSFQLWEPVALKVTPEGTQVIVAAGDGISILTRNAVTGGLSSPASGPTCLAADTGANGNPCHRAYGMYANAAVAISPDGKSIYGASARSTPDSGVGILNRDPATGLVTVPSATASCLTQSGLAFQWGTPGTSACDTGRYTAASTDVVVSPDGRNVYAVNQGIFGGPQAAAINVFRRNVVSGAIVQPGDAAGCLSQSGYSGQCLADTTHSSAIGHFEGVAISPDGNNVYTVDSTTFALLVLKREPEPEPEPAIPAGGGSSPASGGAAGGGSAAGGGTAVKPRQLAGGFLLRRGNGTTTGTVPAGATRVTQTARTGGSAATQGFLEMARAKTAKGKCTIAVVRSKKTKKVTKRTYRCTIRLTKGAWTVTTTARGRAVVVAQGSRRVVVR